MKRVQFKFDGRSQRSVADLQAQGLEVFVMPIAEDERAALDRAVLKSTQPCPGGLGCACCGTGCDCGCRNDCPRFRGLILHQIRNPR